MSGSDTDKYSEELCRERLSAVSKRIDAQERRTDKVDAKINGLILALISSLLGVATFVAKMLFDAVFTVGPK